MTIIRRVGLIALIGILSLMLVFGATRYMPPTLTWRVRLLTAKLTGSIPQIPLEQLIAWMRPGSPVDLHHLAFVPNVDASVMNIFTDGQSAGEGARLFGRSCASCHGDDARGRNAPNLVAAITNMDDWRFFSTVKWGIPNTLMTAKPLSDRQIWDVEAFIRQLAVYTKLGESGSAADTRPFPAVSPGMLLTSGEAGRWLMYAGNYAGYRHGEETQINARNVHLLRLAWAAQLPMGGSVQESSPIVDDDRMVVTEPGGGVTALDARTGAVLWQFQRSAPAKVRSCCSNPNRGAAILGKNVYVATFDGHLLALDAASGYKVWDVKVADWHHGYSMTGAPLAIGHSIVVGVAGGEFGVRGFIASYSASDGALQWKFYTIPGPGEPGHDTWAGDSWKSGGGTTWVTGAYDPSLNLIYWGTGNPGPDFNSELREGDNLYTCSIVALDARTGKLRWYFQFTPGDDHDWDSTQQPVLVDIPWQGQTIPALLLANRNGFLYALDRRTGRFLYAKAFAKQTWNAGFTPAGRPIVLPSAHPSRMGTVISPPVAGGTSWWPPSFDPQRDLLFIPSEDSADRYFDTETPRYVQGSFFVASGFIRAPDFPTTMAVRAFDAATGELRWSSTLKVGGGDVASNIGGVLSTAGGVVFAGHENEFDALDADTGKVLWRTPLGGPIHASPISYQVDGQEYVAIFSAGMLFTFCLPPEQQQIEGKQQLARSAGQPPRSSAARVQ